MTESELIDLGFKKVESSIPWTLAMNDYWYEMNIGDHQFITNDSYFNGNNDHWHIGYGIGDNAEVNWFDTKLNSIGDFRAVYRNIIGTELKFTVTI